MAIGLRFHSRHYFLAGTFTLLASAVVQFGPAFIDLSRWAQLGISGTILLSAGLLALFRREQILQTRQRFTEKWQQWDA